WSGCRGAAACYSPHPSVSGMGRAGLRQRRRRLPVGVSRFASWLPPVRELSRPPGPDAAQHLLPIEPAQVQKLHWIGPSARGTLAGIMQGYGQYCPIAKAAEILGQRWTLLILRDLLYGARRFNEVRRGVPRMSQSLLSQRLKNFERFALVVRVRDRESGAIGYDPTPAARARLPVLDLLAPVGRRRVRHGVTRDELDVNFLVWYVRLGIDADKFPPERTVIEFDYTDRPRLSKDPWWADKWWLIIEKGEVDLCVTDPGYEVDLFVVT